MRNQVKYEWCIEVVDEDGDIIDIDFADSLPDLLSQGIEGELCLVRNEGNEIDGLTDRAWAYVKEGILPDCFSDERGYQMPAMKVPKKFKIEFEKYHTK